MPRRTRIKFPGAVYHIMNRGNNRQKIFLERKDYETYLELLERCADNFAIVVYAYCLLNTHLHLLIETPRGNVSEFMRSLHLGYVREYKRRHHFRGHLFQERFKSIIVDRDLYLVEVSRYIHLNPLRAGIVKRPEEYEWSSYPYYIESGRDTFLHPELILEYMGESEENRKKYQEFVNDLIDTGKIEPSPVYAGLFYGTKTFAQKVWKKIERRKEDKQKNLFRQEDLRRRGLKKFESIVDRVSKFYRIDNSNLINGYTHEIVALKHQTMYLARRYTNLGLKEIAKKLGVYHPSAVSKAIVRLGHKRAEDKELDEKLNKLEKRIAEM